MGLPGPCQVCSRHSHGGKGGRLAGSRRKSLWDKLCKQMRPPSPAPRCLGHLLAHQHWGGGSSSPPPSLSLQQQPRGTLLCASLDRSAAPRRLWQPRDAGSNSSSTQQDAAPDLSSCPHCRPPPTPPVTYIIEKDKPSDRGQQIESKSPAARTKRGQNPGCQRPTCRSPACSGDAGSAVGAFAGSPPPAFINELPPLKA